MANVRIQSSTGSRAEEEIGRLEQTPLRPLHAVADHAHELADAQHKVLDRIGHLGVRARLGEIYTRFTETLAVFERALERFGWAPPGLHGPRTDVRLREIVGIDGVGADLGLLAELDERAAVLLARIGEVREHAVPAEVVAPMRALAELARDIRAEYESLSL
jgi:hypothetical protein